MPGRRLIVEADGGSRGNPGPAGYGAVVRDAETGRVLAEVSEPIGRATNNVAEYRGLIAGLRAATTVDPDAVVDVRMDSKLVVEQMSGRWQIKHPDIRPLASAAAALARRFPAVSYTWVPRTRNAHADRLANEAMDAAAHEHGDARTGVTRPTGRRSRTPDDPDQGRTGSGIGRTRGSGWLPAHLPPTVTLLLRHGQTTLSMRHRFAGVGDVPLTATGARQATAAGVRLANRGDVDAIITSPLLRARQTAERVAAAVGAPVTTDDGFRETDFGAWEGLTFAEAQRRWPAEVTAWLADPAVAPPGGESFTEVAARVRAALNRVLATHPGRTVVVVSHVTPIKSMLADALLAPLAALYRMHLDVGCLNEIHWYPDGPAVVRSLNDTAHLDEADAQAPRRPRPVTAP